MRVWTIPIHRDPRSATRAAQPAAHVCRAVYLAWGAWLCLLTGCGSSLDGRNAHVFQQAQQTFDQARSHEDFLRAAAMYQEIIDGGVASGAVWYNQGNAFMQAGQRGRAIAAYRQAQRYRPRDPYLEANLRFALRNSTLPRRSLMEYVLFWQNWLSLPEKYWLLGLAAGVAFVLGLIGLLSERRQLSRLALATLVPVLLLVLSVGYDAYRYRERTHGVVVQPETVARKGDAVSYEPALTGPLEEGTEFHVVERRGDWLLVHLPGGQEGWIEQHAAVLY